MGEKIGKSRSTLFFQWFGSQEGRKVGSLKRRVRSQQARWEVKNCTPLWMCKTHQFRTIFGSCDVEKVHAVVARGTHFELKMLKILGVRTTFGSCNVEKVHAVVARSTFLTQNVKNTKGSDHFERCDVEKCTPLWRRSTFRSENAQKTPCSVLFSRFRCRFAWQAQGIVHLVKRDI